MSWENDKELTQTSKFIRFPEGLNEYTLMDDGTKVRNSFGKACVEFAQPDEKILSLRPGAILDAIRKAKLQHGTIVGRKISFTRVGTTKEDTRYENIKVV